MDSRTWIVIVNYRTPDLAIECLRSIAPEVADLCGGRVIVIDNASGGLSVEKLEAAITREGWSSWAEVMPLERNGGFAFGNNAGIRAALNAPEGVEYVMLLNPDTLVRPGALKALLGFMQTHPEAGVAGSLLETPEGGVDCSAHRIHSPLSELDGSARLGILSRLLQRHVVSPPPQSQAHACDWVSGACMIMRRSVLETIGLMDEGYFLYFEEVDFCWRAKQAGFSVWYVPQARVMHLEGASTGIRTNAVRRAAYWYDSRRRFFIKHYGVTGLALADAFWIIGRASLLLRNTLGLGGRSIEADPKRFTLDLLGGDMRAILSRRARSIARDARQA